MIDAHNIIHQIPGLRNRLGTAHLSVFSDFCVMVSRQVSATGTKAKVVFDGVRQYFSAPSGIEIMFSGKLKADDIIIQQIKKDGAADRWIVISDDREIRQQAHYYGVETMRSAEFLRDVSFTGTTAGTGGMVSDPGESPNPSVPGIDEDELLRMFRENRGKP